MNARPCSAPGCGKRITFAKNARTGNAMVFDAESTTAWVVEGDPPVARAVQVRTPHHATCSDPEFFRKGR